jgi:hypothetical protein
MSWSTLLCVPSREKPFAICRRDIFLHPSGGCGLHGEVRSLSESPTDRSPAAAAVKCNAGGGPCPVDACYDPASINRRYPFSMLAVKLFAADSKILGDGYREFENLPGKSV